MQVLFAVFTNLSQFLFHVLKNRLQHSIFCFAGPNFCLSTKKSSLHCPFSLLLSFGRSCNNAFRQLLQTDAFGHTELLHLTVCFLLRHSVRCHEDTLGTIQQLTCLQAFLQLIKLQIKLMHFLKAFGRNLHRRKSCSSRTGLTR